MSLHRISIFEDLNEDDLTVLTSLMEKKNFDAGELLFREGDPGDEMFVVVSGRVSISVQVATGEEMQLTQVESGGFFGEMCLIENIPRSASCRTVEPSVLLGLHAHSFENLTKSHPAASLKIMNRMLRTTVERLGNTDAFLTQIVQYGEASRKRALTDPATGLFNRRYLEENFEALVNRSRVSDSPLTFVMFDLDRFGSLNTKYGLEFGDKVIVEVAKVFTQVFEPNDILVRYGGDEFLFLFPGSTGDRAQAKCDALCEAVRRLRFAEHEDLRLTCSLGYAVYPYQTDSGEDLKQKADKALYWAKERGRDRAIGFA